MKRQSISWCAVAACLTVLIPASVQAQAIGARAGASGDPDQFYFGIHAESGPIADRLRFRPNIEVGIGDNLTLVALNVEFIYRQPLRRSRWSVFAGGGPAANVYVVDRGIERGNESDVRGGINVLVGADHSDGFFTELKVGLIDSPSIKVGVGISFRR